ncbi:TonB-dependent receptor SusC [bacterium HR33]|nr:TonB-dependent receptor SusC [bacterium HR33]
MAGYLLELRPSGWRPMSKTALFAAWASILLGLCSLPVPVIAQQVTSGTVVDAVTRRPLDNAFLTIEGTGVRTTTDLQGRFRFTAPPGTVRVLVTRLGYRPVTLTVQSGATEVVVALQQAAVSLDEVVVTGTPGAQQARALGNAVDKLEVASVAEIAPAADLSELLSGQVPGVRIMRVGGEVGSGGNTRIRGVRSLSLPATPLVYVDGVRVNNADNEPGVGFRAVNRPSRINDLNPEEIESIEVIKGPAAATLYGTEASNGVIQIITKKGRQGRPTVNLRVRQGAAWLPDPFNLFPPTYYKNKAGEIVEFNVLKTDCEEYGNCNWFVTGHLQSYGAEMRGGSESVQYYFSADWDRDEGAVPYNWKHRLSGRANLTYVPNQALTIDFSLGGIRSKAQAASTQQPVTTAIIWSCPSPGCEKGSGTPNAIDGPFRGYIAYLPEIYEEDVEGFEDVDRTIFSLSARHEPFAWLNQRLTVGGDYGLTKTSQLFRATGRIGNIFPNGRRDVWHVRNTFVNVDYGATATVRPIGHLSLATSAGVQFYRKAQEIVSGRADVFPVKALETLSSGALRISDEDFVENKTFGAYVQEQLSWKDRIFLTGALRGDDNSAFGRQFDFVMYPKLSASWVVTDEPFLSDNPLISTLKLRAAWGKAGQQPDVFAALRTYEPSVGPGGAPTLTPGTIGNDSLKPEVGRELEVGFDAGLLNERIGLEFTYFDQRTEDAIVSVPALPSLGFPGSQFRNLGVVSNKGFEVNLRARVLRSANIDLDINLALSTNSNKVVDLGGLDPLVQDATSGQYHVPEFPLAGIFFKRVVAADTVTQAGRRVATNVMCEGGEVVPGTNFSRGGGAPVPCAQAPFVYWGQPVPTREGSVSATLTLFQNLQLFGLVDYVDGHKLISGDLAAVHRFFLNSKAILERKDPILLGYEALGGLGLWQPGIIDGGFAKLRTVTLSYTLPSTWAQKIRASRASLIASFENLATLWVAQRESFGHRQMDPEVRWSVGGTTQGLSAYNQEGFPQLKRFTVSARVTF